MKLGNLEDFLIWLDANPKKTHGSGRLLASVCDEINYKDALAYISDLQNRGSIPYGVFEKTGSNCSRFVTDTILAATDNERIIRRLKFNKLFTPSTVGNVEKAATGNPVYEVYKGVVSQFYGSALRENLTNYFHKKEAPSKNGASKNNLLKIPSHFQKLEGTGSIAYFEVVPSNVLPKLHYRIKRYNNYLDLDFDGVYKSQTIGIYEDHTFVYDSHCAYCHILQNGVKIKLDCVETYANFNSSRKEYLT
jgi:hypothetical protein